MAVKTQTNEFLSPKPTALYNGGESALPTTSDAKGDDKSKQAWHQLIDYRLIEWGCNSDPWNDEGVDPPSPETITRAIELAQRLQAKGLPAPDSVVPDANGGIVFERREQGISEVVHIWSDGSTEYQQFDGTRLVERTPL